MKYCSFISAAMVLLAIHCSDPSSSSEKRPQVIVDQDITEDTVWESGKDYIIQGIVILKNNVSLTIRKDVHIYFDKDKEKNLGQLEVQGLLIANGIDSTGLIIFQPLKYDQDSELQRGIKVDKSAKRIHFSNCLFRYFIYGVQASETQVEINNCTFESCTRAITISKSNLLKISDCEFNENDYDIQLELTKGISDTSIIAINNRFLSTQNTAIEINNYSESRITNNIFDDCSLAIDCHDNSMASIQYNDFTHCQTSVFYKYVYNGQVIYNNFLNGDIFVRIEYSSTIQVNNNNFENAMEYDMQIRLHTDMTIDAENNWWGTNLKQEIERLIYDKNDYSSGVEFGTVDFEPFLNSKILIEK